MCGVLVIILAIVIIFYFYVLQEQFYMVYVSWGVNLNLLIHHALRHK